MAETTTLELVTVDVDLDAEVICYPHQVRNDLEHPADIIARSTCGACGHHSGPVGMCWDFHRYLGGPKIRLICPTCRFVGTRDEVVTIVQVLR